MASSAANSSRASPCPHRNFDSGELSLFWCSETLVEDQEDDKDEENFSAPPPYALNDVSNVEHGQVAFSENPPRETSEGEETRSRFPVVTVCEVDLLEESPESSPNIDTEFRLRGGDGKERYEKLMTKPHPSVGSSDESNRQRVKLTVAKMTKNYHMVSSSEDWSEHTSISRYSDQYNFETDQAEVWDSIIMGSRTLQEVCDNRQTLAWDTDQKKAKPIRILRRMPSSERLRQPYVEKVLQESIELRKLPEEAPTDWIQNGADVVAETSTSNSVQKQRSQPSLSKRRQISSTMIRVEYPKTMNLAAHAEMYESKSKAITALYEYKLGELSNFCTYDPATRTIFAHALESSVPNPAVLRRAGLEVLWLPMQKEIHHLIQFKEKAQDKTNLPLGRDQSPVVVGEQCTLETDPECLASGRPTTQLNPNTLSDHNERMLVANLYNFDRHGSQFEAEAEFIDPRSPSSSLQLDPSSPQREKEPSIFDDDFFLEVDPDIARGFLGSQYSEASRSASCSGNHLLPAGLLETDSASDVLWSLEDEDQDARPVKTWVELARAFLAGHPAQPVRGSEDNDTSSDGDFKWAELFGSSRRSSRDVPHTEHIEDMKAYKEDHWLKGRYHRRHSFSSIPAEEVGEFNKWVEQFLFSDRCFPAGPHTEYVENIKVCKKDHSLAERRHRRASLSSILAEGDFKCTEPLITSERSSSAHPYTQDVEDIEVYENDHDWRIRHSRQSRLATLMEQQPVKPPKGYPRCSWVKSWPRSRSGRPIFPSEDAVDSEVMDFSDPEDPKENSNDPKYGPGQCPEFSDEPDDPKRDRDPCPEFSDEPEDPKGDRGQLSEFSDEKDGTGCEVVNIPFPTKDVLNGSSRRSSISFTSYIEAERAQERLYQTYPLLPPVKVETESKGKGIKTENFLDPLTSAGDDKGSYDLIDSAPMFMTTVGPQLDSQDSPERSTRTESDSDEQLEKPVMSIASGFRPIDFHELLANELIPQKLEIGSEDSRSSEDSGSSEITLPSGFKFTKHRERLVGKGISKDVVSGELSENSAIPLPSGFPFTKHRRQIMKSEDSRSPVIFLSASSKSANLSESIAGEEKSNGGEAIPGDLVIEYSATTASPCIDKPFEISVPTANDLVGGQEIIPQLAAQTTVKESGSDELALKDVRGDVPGDSRNRLWTARQLCHKMAKEHGSDELFPEQIGEGLFTSPVRNDGLPGCKGNSSELACRKMGDKVGCDELGSEEIEDSDLTPVCRGSRQVHSSTFWQAQIEDLNIRVVGKAARQGSPAKQEGRVGALVDIFQARGIMPSMKPALHRQEPPTPFRKNHGDRPTTPTARIVTPSGSTYHPAGTVCIPAGRPSSRSPIKRVLTPMSLIVRARSGSSSIDTNVSELFGEELERVEKHPEEYAESYEYEEI
jgi:hypothetical protein